MNDSSNVDVIYNLKRFYNIGPCTFIQVLFFKKCIFAWIVDHVFHKVWHVEHLSGFLKQTSDLASVKFTIPAKYLKIILNASSYLYWPKIYFELRYRVVWFKGLGEVRFGSTIHE
jgi:hypothetical protein